MANPLLKKIYQIVNPVVVNVNLHVSHG